MSNEPADDAQDAEENQRLPILKTYKLYIDGKFPRTESGRYYTPEADGVALGNICQATWLWHRCRTLVFNQA